MLNKILFVFEGKKPEKQFSQSLQNHVLQQETNIVVECVFDAEIYQLYNKVKDDEFFDTFELLKQKDPRALEEFTRNDFAEIYLFFDYDGHATIADDATIVKMLSIFDNETEQGKLFISYPMSEALKHITESFQDLCVPCKKNIRYKNIVPATCDKQFVDIRKYNIDIWKFLIDIHLCKMNYIALGDFELPNQIIDQDYIFAQQLEKFIKPKSEVSVLSAFPAFIHDYFGNKKTIEMIRC